MHLTAPGAVTSLHAVTDTTAHWNMFDPPQYTVGWICALALELTAARQFLDDEHDAPDRVAANDTNAYTMASAAANMLNSFPNIKFGLMVGIGGGAPSEMNDIRLGDIVVSKPTNGHGGVYQYDFGKKIQVREFLPTGHLNQPPSAVLAALQKLQSNHENDGHQINEAIRTVLEKRPRLARKYRRPTPDQDCLYHASVEHPHEDDRSCEELCGTEPSKVMQRHQREADEDDPAIHYGAIASANQVMKDAYLRDDLARKKGILCFEMEAAGLMNQFPCLVVRGVCDYSDSHKNKKWQGYAAMTAAAYTRDLLATIKPRGLENERRLKDVLGELSNKLTTIQDDTRQLRTAMEESTQMNLADKIRDWLSPSDASVSLEKALDHRHQDTCDLYRYWRTTPDSFLWLYGISGCGKTVLASSVINQLRSEDQASPTAFFYFDVNGGGRRDLPQMLRSLLFQLGSRSKEAAEQVQKMYEECRRYNTSATIKQLSATLKAILHKLSSITVVIDALDECDSPSDVIAWLEDLHEEHIDSLHLLITSQKYGSLDNAICCWPRQDQLYCVGTDD
ncbi:hypothetical protein D6D18_03960, partial [Aureobasidium pullulans]